MRPSDCVDSPLLFGGTIPGANGAPAAWCMKAPNPSPLPVVLAVPHAGRIYPPSLLARMREPETVALRLEDRYVDRLAEAVAAATGAALLVARAPRAMIDLNRAADDVDWSMFSGGGARRPIADRTRTARRAHSGLGLIPRRLPAIGELWRQPHAPEELAERIALVHHPYHDQLARALAEVRSRWGAALLLDLHSMPPLPPEGGRAGAAFVLGDRFGVSCQGRLVAASFAALSGAGHTVAYNRPYAGGYVLERHAAPRDGVHAIQLEIDRASYLDPPLTEIGQGFEGVVHALVGLVARLAREVAAIGAAGWAEAAE